MNLRYRKQTSALLLRSSQAESERDELASEITRLTYELDSLKAEHALSELVATKLLHDKIELGRQLLQQQYLLDLLQGRAGNPFTIIFRSAKAAGFR